MIDVKVGRDGGKKTTAEREERAGMREVGRGDGNQEGRI
jgi:hypothetical protein